MSNVVSIGFSTPKSFNPVSWIIRKLTKSRASHTWFLYYDADFEMWMVMEAHELGFRLIPFERFRNRNEVVAIFTTKTSLSDGLKWAAKWLGTAYDFGGLIGMAWVVLGRILKRRWRNPLQNSHAMFCSEMALTVLQLSGVGWSKLAEPHETSPQDLLDMFEDAAEYDGDAIIVDPPGKDSDS
jgi:hypothetical protein